MKQVRWFHALGLALITLMLSVTLWAQGDPKALLLNKLNEQFTATRFTADKSNIVTAGVMVALKEDGLLVYPANLPAAPVSVPKNGKLTQGFGDMFKVGMVDGIGIEGGAAAIPTHTLVAGEKVWVSAFGIEKDSILVQVVTEPYDDGRYFANIKFLIAKGSIPAPDDAVKMVSGVLEVQESQDQAAQEADNSPATYSAQNTQGATFSGQYRTSAGSQLIFLSDGTFTKIVGNGQSQGQFSVNEDTLTLTFPSTGFSQCIKIQGDKLIACNGSLQWVRTGNAPAPATQTAASAPAALAPPKYPEDPPPPPPPTPAPTITLGERKAQVTADFGEPQRKATNGPKEIYFYTDLKMKVTFTNGKVSNVE
jgi:hypothetical protein